MDMLMLLANGVTASLGRSRLGKREKGSRIRLGRRLSVFSCLKLPK
jgi:hypothetical protein